MAKRLAVPSKELELVLVGAKDSFKASRVQKLSLGKDIPVTTVDEIGNHLHVGTTKDMPNVTLTFSAFDVGIKIASVLAGVDPNAYPSNGVDVAQLGEVDAIVFVKDADVAKYAKSLHGHRLQISQVTFNYSVDGEASEDYTATGSTMRWLKYDVVVDKFTSPGTSATASKTPIQLQNGDYLLSAISDGGFLKEVASTPGAGEYSVSGTGVTLGEAYTATLTLVYHANASSAWADVSEPGMPVAIKGKDVGIKILANDIPRVQSVTINVNLNSTPVKEMGNRAMVGYQTQIPTLTGNITVLDTDTELISLLTNGTVTSSGVNEWMPGEGCTTTPISLLVELHDPCDIQYPFSVVKSIYLPSISVVGDAYSVNVNGNAQEVFAFTSEDAQCILFSGEMP